MYKELPCNRLVNAFSGRGREEEDREGSIGEEKKGGESLSPITAICRRGVGMDCNKSIKKNKNEDRPVETRVRGKPAGKEKKIVTISFSRKGMLRTNGG